MARPKRTGQAEQYWQRMIEEQQRSGQRIRPFCREHGVGEHSFYVWRRRLQQERQPQAPLRFALVDRRTGSGLAPSGDGHEPATLIELILPTGEQLRIRAGVDGDTLRTLLTALRASHA